MIYIPYNCFLLLPYNVLKCSSFFILPTNYILIHVGTSAICYSFTLLRLLVLLVLLLRCVWGASGVFAGDIIFCITVYCVVVCVWLVFCREIQVFPVLVSLFEKPTQIARILYKAHRSDKLYHSVDEVPPNQRKQAFAGVCRCVVFFVCPCTSSGFRGKQPAPPRAHLMFAIFSGRHFLAIFGKRFQETGFRFARGGKKSGY